MGVLCKSDHFAAYQNKACTADTGYLMSAFIFFLAVHLNIVIL